MNIKMNFTEGTADFYRDIDVLTYFENHIYEKCNVLIIQYLISFFYDKVGKKGLRSWFEQLADRVVKYKPRNSPMLIIINDADSIYTERDAFSLLIDEIENASLEISMELRKRFKGHDYYEDSEQ